MLTLYELAGADESVRFSPYCWRIVMALAHKGLAVTRVPVRFTDKALIAFSGQDKVPVLRDGEGVIDDSTAIADHIEARYPDRPLFGGSEGRALATFFRHWTERALQAPMLPVIALDILARLDPVDARYFRRTREARFGRSLEDAAAEAPGRLATLKLNLSPLRATLAEQPFLTGAAPAYADYIVFGAVQWARVASPRDLLAGEEPIIAWRERMLDLHDGLARATPAAAG